MDRTRRVGWLAILSLAAGTAAQAALPDLEGATALAGARSIACVARATGGAACWGEGDWGGSVLGRSTSGRAAGPVGGLSGPVARIAVGAVHACAITADARLWCWGANPWGQLGIGGAIAAGSPAPVPALAAVADVAAGEAHTCAVAAGGAFCWGANYNGELGDGTTIPRDTPVPVAGLATGVERIAVAAQSNQTGGRFTCAVAGGATLCWGGNGAGQLGDGTLLQRVTPVPVVGLAAGTTDLSAGATHACAVQAGAAKCWGGNQFGQLGDGTFSNRLAPVSVVNAAHDVVAVAAGAQHSCALRSDGTMLCWGSNADGQLGDGTQDLRTIAAPVAGLAGPAVAIAAGDGFSCALLASGRVQCFGRPLGIGFMHVRTKPVPVDEPSGVRRISAGDYGTCGVSTPGAAFCFGNGDAGALGNGSRAIAPRPTPVTGLAAGVADVVTRLAHSCARTEAGGALCWGRGEQGRLGNGTVADSLVPVPVVGLGSGVTDLAVGASFSCAVAGGGARCWGDNGNGQLGAGEGTGWSSVPVTPWGLGQGVLRTWAGTGHACALRSGGGLKCWGENTQGVLGDGTTIHRYTPVDVVGMNRGVRDASLGARHSCAIDMAGALWCWGYNFNGQLGDGSQTARPVPVPAAGIASGAIAVAAGHAHTCALLANGEVRCWGSNHAGQSGPGAVVDTRVAPVTVPLGEPAFALSAGAEHTCAILAGGRARCWGNAADGRLGNGIVERSPLPRTVAEGEFVSTVALSVAPDPSANGEYVTITARVDTPETVPAGTVTFSDGPAGLSCPDHGAAVQLVAGSASCSVPLFTGVHELRAEYGGSPDALPSVGVHTHVVGAVPGQHCAQFDDVDATNPFCRDVEWLRNRAITQGCTPFAFCPADPVTRLTMAAFLDRLGGTIGPAVETSSFEIFQAWPTSVGTCFTGVSQRPHPAHVVVDLIVSGVPSAAATLSFEPVQGLVAGPPPTGLAIGPSMRVTADASRALAVRLAGSVDVEPGTAYSVGVRFSADTLGFTLSDVRCIVRKQLFDRVGTHAPFDAPKGDRP